MITVINDKELGKVTIVTQQYQVGLYVAIYKNKRLINQFGSKDSPPKCSDCERWGTMDCPISYMCYSTKDKSYFKSKQDE